MSSTERLLDAAGHQRSPVTMPGYHRGRPPVMANKTPRRSREHAPAHEATRLIRMTIRLVSTN